MGVGDHPAAEHARAALVSGATEARDVADVFAVVSPRLRRLVPFDGAVWVSTDPATGFPAGPTRVDDVGGITFADCSAHWRHEFADHDHNTFRALARGPRPARSLRAVVSDPDESVRFRTFVQPLGFADELRAVLRDGDAPWGLVSLWRRPDGGPFTRAETELVNGLSAPLAAALRRHARPVEVTGRGQDVAPGVLVFSPTGELRAADDRAVDRLRDLPADHGAAAAAIGPAVPLWLRVTVFRAAGSGTARARVRSRDGAWLTCHASSVRRRGEDDEVVVVLQPAAAAEIAPIAVAALELTPREQEITRLIARGAATAEIADELLVSTHTVRDHVKAIFQKAGVSSRGELVAKVYAEFYEADHQHEVVRCHAV